MLEITKQTVDVETVGGRERLLLCRRLLLIGHVDNVHSRGHDLQDKRGNKECTVCSHSLSLQPGNE